MKQDEAMKNETKLMPQHSVECNPSAGVWVITHEPGELCALLGPHPMRECLECEW